MQFNVDGGTIAAIKAGAYKLTLSLQRVKDTIVRKKTLHIKP